MKKKIVMLFVFVNIQLAFCQIQNYEDSKEIEVQLQEYLRKRTDLDTVSVGNYLVFSFFTEGKREDFENESCFLIRVGCSVCYDIILFKNNTEFEIVNLFSIEKLMQSALYFLQDETDTKFEKYLDNLVERYIDQEKVRQSRERKIRVVRHPL